MADDVVDDGEQTAAIIYQGASLRQLEAIFGVNTAVIKGKISGIAPAASRRGVPVWAIRDVAPVLVKPTFDVESAIRKMSHTDLPKTLSKEFWAGQRSKQEYQIRAGELWETGKVVECVGDLFKLVSMSLKLMRDNVERQTELTLKQRHLLTNLCDGTLLDMRQAVIDKFKKDPVEVEKDDDDEEI